MLVFTDVPIFKHLEAIFVSRVLVLAELKLTLEVIEERRDKMLLATILSSMVEIKLEPMMKVPADLMLVAFSIRYCCCCYC
jgi:hypothetical protein